MANPQTKQIERIVVRGTNWVGDAVMTVPALRELRRVFPGAHITLVTRSTASDLFIDADFVDEVMISDGRGLRAFAALVRQWRKGNFDLAVLMTNSFQAALVAFLARVPLRFGYASDRRQALLTHPLDLPEWRSTRHEVFYYLQIVAAVEWIVKHEQTFLETDPNFALAVSESRRAAAIDLLAAYDVDPSDKSRPIVVLCPGSINSRAKRWPVDRYANLADKFIDDLGARVLLIGSRGEAEVSAAVASQMRGQPVRLTGKTSLRDAVAVLSLADIVITNDTGPAHVASALGRPTLVIFGPTNPLTTRPFSPRGEIIREPPDCAPCMLRDCPIDHRCMTAISPEEVFERAQSILRPKRVGSCEMPGTLAAAIEKFRFAEN